MNLCNTNISVFFSILREVVFVLVLNVVVIGAAAKVICIYEKIINPTNCNLFRL